MLDAVLDNALKYTPPGKRVRVATLRIAGRVGVSVVDGGPGCLRGGPPGPPTGSAGTGQSNVEGSGLAGDRRAHRGGRRGILRGFDPAPRQ
ncbi:sensor histidine kinase [Pseudonocardia sp. MCCB 268]|nr:sensor histidine kinase [Pseudonocardia cytotoxica]